MMILESALAVRFRNKTTTTSTTTSLYPRPWFNHDEVAPPSVHFTPGLNSSILCLLSTRRRKRINWALRAGDGPAEHSSDSDPPSSYHPFEDIGEPSSTSLDSGDARPTPAEITRTLIEVNSKATLMFSGLIDDQLPDTVFWPDLPYLTDEHGTSCSGSRSVEILNEMELGPSDIDFGFEDIMEEASDDEDNEGDDANDDYENDWVDVLDDEEDDMDSDETLGIGLKLGTIALPILCTLLRRCPSSLFQAASDNPMMDCMYQPPSGLCIQGLLQPAFIEESSVIRKHMSDRQSHNDETYKVEKLVEDSLDVPGINGHDHNSDLKSSSQNGSIWAEEEEKDENLRTGSSFYKLEMVKIQLISPHGNQAC
ncbi:hypothetical protein IFM89_039433 [Coptis chinensis]|uniref:Uncharacterized protein n=1 Tax=Coptis chinensis TaxID=261450 RepID=A0A835IHT8_9MAGN|nr:hypothetical protein IFM89_039433 [Coptis chinensis]